MGKIWNYLAQIDAGSVNIPNTTSDYLWQGILDAIYFVAGAACVIVIIIAGYIYVTSVGNPTSVSKAKNAILYAVIGLVVIILAFVITRFVIGSIA